jgi:hypothetical protein
MDKNNKLMLNYAIHFMTCKVLAKYVGNNMKREVYKA